MKHKKKFKPCEALIFDPGHGINPGWKCIKRGELVFFLGEVPNAKGHCIVLTTNNTYYTMLHIEDFRRPTNEEF